MPPVASCPVHPLVSSGTPFGSSRECTTQRSERTQPPFKHPVSPSLPLQSRRVEEEAVRGTEAGVKDEFVDADEVPR